MSWLIDLLYRSKKNYKLTPQERAILKSFEGALIAFISFAAPYLLPVLVGNAHLTLSGAIVSTLIGAFVAAILKLYFAQNDPQLGAILDAYAKEKERQALQQMVQPGVDNSIPALNLIVPVVGALAQPVRAPISMPPTGGSVIAPITDQPTAPTLQAVKPFPTQPAMPTIVPPTGAGGIVSVTPPAQQITLAAPPEQSSGTNISDAMTISTPAVQANKGFVPPQLTQE